MEWLFTAPGWVLGAIIGAAFGIVGGLIGLLAERSGFAWGRYVPIIFIAIGLGAARESLTNQLRRAGWTEAATDRALISQMPEVYGYLKDNFSSDYQRLVTESTEIVKQTMSAQNAARATAEVMAAIRRQYAPMLALAPDENLNKLIELQRGFYSQMLTSDGAETCAQVAVNGPIVLAGTPAAERIQDQMADQVLAFFQAVHAAIRSPVQRGVSSDNDWALVGEQMANAGATEADFATMAVSDPNDLNVCPAFLKMIDAMTTLPAPYGPRVIATHLSETSST